MAAVFHLTWPTCEFILSLYVGSASLSDDSNAIKMLHYHFYLYQILCLVFIGLFL